MIKYNNTFHKSFSYENFFVYVVGIKLQNNLVKIKSDLTKDNKSSIQDNNHARNYKNIFLFCWKEN